VTEQRSPEQIQADIEQTRQEVGDTVEALAAKTDVKARVQDRVEEIKANVKAKTPSNAQDGSKAVTEQVKRNPAPFVLGGAVLLAFLIGRRTARP
jgi:hypothetical protein